MEAHPNTVRTYYQVFAALLSLTALTVAVAFIDLGLWNHVLLLGIATGKALAVMLYFMHLRYSRRLSWVVAGAGFFWLLIFITLTMSDYLTRTWLPSSGGWRPLG